MESPFRGRNGAVRTRSREVIATAAGIAALLNAVAVCCVLAESDLEVRKELIIVSPPGRNGCVTVKGAPGAVVSASMVAFVVENSDTDKEVGGAVHTDGSFIARIQGEPGDRIKIRLISTQSGKKKKVSRRVPSRTSVRRGDHSPAPREREIVIRYKGKATGRSTTAAGDAEIRRSGVLPPD